MVLTVPLREMVPLLVPPAVGVKLTPIVALCPAPRTSGKLGPVRANPCPEIAAWVTVRVPTPRLDKVAVSVWVLPTGTLPKLTIFGFRIIAPDPVDVPCAKGWFALRVEQPSIQVRLRRTTKRLLRAPKSSTEASKTPYEQTAGDLPAAAPFRVPIPQETETWDSAVRLQCALWVVQAVDIERSSPYGH